MRAPAEPPRPFSFFRDTFAFAHELVWQYRFDPATGAMTTFPTQPPPAYYHRCFVLVRSVRQFFLQAHFAPDLPAGEPEVHRRLIRQVVSRNPRAGAAPREKRIVIPGFEGLRAYSQKCEALLKAECGEAWESYFLRTHWRIVFPVWARHQFQVAQQLRRRLEEGWLPAVHLFRFPQLTINHGLLLVGFEESAGEIRFQAYDPNIPEHPVPLSFDLHHHRFSFPPAKYWKGGTVSVIEIYR